MSRPSFPRPRRFYRLGLGATVALLFWLVGPRCWAADAGQLESRLLDGDYAGVLADAEAAAKESPENSAWPLLRARALIALGRWEEARRGMQAALSADSRAVRLRWLDRDLALQTGRKEDAAQRLDEIRSLLRGRSWGYRPPADIVTFGRAALVLGADPKDVLDQVFAVAQKADPRLRDVYLARAELALEKHDFALAAKVADEGLKQLPDDPDLLVLRAKAFANGSREETRASVAAALKRNPRHVPALLMRAEALIDAEAYAEAAETLDRIDAVNPAQPEAWAQRAVLAHLRGDEAGETLARARALGPWAQNPRVDHLIGAKLSQKYRFAEGAASQRRALAMDPEYLPALSQLASDLLRLGEDKEGWELARRVHERDEYDVEAFNLVTLQDTMAKYATLSGDGIVVRMSSKEVAVYGPRVLALLRRAKRTLTEKYGAELADPTYVEILAEQKDFAVRTFGLPDVPGFLGVCFGRVVTANSPASRSDATNWESVLWHEFCHVVTLQLTRNRMPRWLSEGISVHEEHQADPAWGMTLTPTYRQMILKGELVPVGKLSAAFLAPKTPQHLQFAYLQSAMVVDFLVERFGRDALRGVLLDLREGVEINASLARRTVGLEQLEKEFAAYARQRAEQLAPGLDWEKPDPSLLSPAGAVALAAWEKLHPDNLHVLRFRAQQAVEGKRFDEARRYLERLIALYPRQKGSDSAYRVLASVLRSQSDTDGERAVLARWADVDDEAAEGYLRWMELSAEAKDWPAVKRGAERYLAVNPLVAPPYRLLAQAATATGDVSDAMVAWRTLLQLEVPDAVEAHFQLARLLHQRGEHAAALQEVVAALEDAPRYREALQLLREIQRALDRARTGEASTP